jgi:hypothetical protein
MAVADPEGAEPGTDDRWRCVADGVSDVDFRFAESDPRRMTWTYTLSSGKAVEFEHRIAQLIWHGLFSAESKYVVGDVVAWNGGSWVCQQDGTTKAPGDGADWALMAKQGKPGARGVDGARGARGEPGVSVQAVTREGSGIMLELSDGTIHPIHLPPTFLPGEIRWIAAGVPPPGWLVCDGSAVPDANRDLAGLVGGRVPNLMGTQPGTPIIWVGAQ